MLEKINHIGIAVPNMEQSKEKYLKNGYRIVRESYDEYFLTDLCLIQKGNEVLELIYTDNPKSKVYELCLKNEEVIYHKCYEVNSIDETIKELKVEKYILISDIVYSKLLSGNVCFLYSKEYGVIELLEVQS